MGRGGGGVGGVEKKDGNWVWSVSSSPPREVQREISVAPEQRVVRGPYSREALAGSWE